MLPLLSCSYSSESFYPGARSLGWILAVLVLTSCAAPSTVPPSTGVITELEVIEQNARDLTRQAESALDPAESSHWRVMAAMAWLREENPGLALEQLDLADNSLLSAEDQYRFAIAGTRARLMTGDTLEALQFARDQELPNQSTVLDPLWQVTLGEAHFANASYFRAAQNFFHCSRSMGNNQEACRQNLWLALNYLDTSDLDNLAQQLDSPALDGWTELARVAQLNLGDFANQTSALNDWQRRYPGHEAAQNLPDTLRNLQTLQANAPRRIAVLLPLTGPLESAGNALLDGVLSAYYASAPRAATAPEIVIYDTESLPLDLLIEILRSESFDGIIGPLERDRVEQFLSSTRINTPVVGLNQVDIPPGREPAAVGMGLAIEGEARQIARDAAQDGHHTAIVMAPNTSWGDRAADTFAASWQELDQSVAAILRYSGSSDQAPLLESALHIDQSNQRRTALQSLLGKQLNFTPRRRQDADMLYLAASPDQARQITPLMAFFFAEDLPVYATSTIYSGGSGTDLNRDLDGVNFLGYPWLFRANPDIASVPVAADNLPQDLKNLQALGVDAYYLMRRYDQLQNSPTIVYHGLTGLLTPGADGNMQRRMPWATFRSGRAALTER